MQGPILIWRTFTPPAVLAHTKEISIDILVILLGAFEVGYPIWSSLHDVSCPGTCDRLADAPHLKCVCMRFLNWIIPSHLCERAESWNLSLISSINCPDRLRRFD